MRNHSLVAHDLRPQVAPPTFGVEEEFFVVDPRTRRILSRAPDLLARTRMDDRLCGEFSRAQVEANSPVCGGAEDARRFLREARRELAQAAEVAGLAVVASGTAVLGDPSSVVISDGARYAEIAAHFGALRESHIVCGCHVHVGIPDRENAVLTVGHLRRWLPFLVAMSANSPFHNGRDTGHASWRTITWNRLPSAGPPPRMRSLDDHERAVRALAASGAILDRHMVYWDVRLSEHLPTLEIRVGDVAATAEEALLFAVLTRGLVSRVLTDVDRGVPVPEVPDTALRAAMWRAARDGLEGVVPDPLTGETLPAAVAMDRLLATALPGLSANGDADLAADLLDRLRRRGSGAARQRAAHARRGRLTDVVDHLVDHTLQGL
ncbi:carboxylate-amine ligase [Nocardiopsis lambiniae]|uniref:Putative glutamate--cysteine ligase 2 n=1 Tax=Nocardiopsis lambiniae TaxID=3075539 RepID=A0ABU2M3G2_9ACTN|nr:glutamate--cysteine ligase [Nocardiopsis sp. DSM 44743]MDT0326846.1 glutamate--cysteine ligase [Nocardiopsis sp. DSM 44743]